MLAHDENEFSNEIRKLREVETQVSVENNIYNSVITKIEKIEDATT